MIAATIAKDLQLQVHRAVFGDTDRHYLLEHGDSQSISDHILNSARATSTGMRLLVRQWATSEDGSERMCSSKQLHREFNSNSCGPCSEQYKTRFRSR